ncbi:MAG TPA: pitrilysin family protein [Acidobacteriota bacterium]|nr:pitrilysin family protein [Acidobacteriota bacterium]
MITRKRFILLLCVLLTASWASAQQVEVEELVLDNGMTFLFVPREGDPNVAAGWLAKVGSANERPGITGISHLFEHMMFKGTHAIGLAESVDIEANLALMSEMDLLKDQLRKEEEELLRRYRLGLIADLNDPQNRSPRHQELIEKFEELTLKEKGQLTKNEFDRIYTQAGGSGMNAGTTRDWTIYFINVPSNKLELWFWMESDRLLNPVFREFYAERDVVREERRLRTESTPTGKFREQFESMFWTSHPYGWPVVGWPSDVESITREEAEAYYDVNYAPNNLVACLVGDYDVETAKELARRYFGRLPRGPKDPEPVRTLEIEQQAEKRMIAYAETNPQVQVRWHSVADGHADEPALLVIGALLNGRSGRLYKSLVLDKEIANRASAGQDGMKWAGYFSVNAVAKQGKDPLEVEQAIYEEIEKLKTELVEERELQKVKNNFAANNFRRIENNFFLMLQLLIADGNRSWEAFNEDPKHLQAVTAEDVQRVAKKYFKDETRAVALYYTKESDKPEDPMLAALSPEQKMMVKQMEGRISQLDADQLGQMLGQLEGGNVSEQMKAVVPVLKKMIEERKKELEMEGQEQ